MDCNQQLLKRNEKKIWDGLRKIDLERASDPILSTKIQQTFGNFDGAAVIALIIQPLEIQGPRAMQY